MVVRSKFTVLRLLAAIALVTMALPVNPVPVLAAEPYSISGTISPAFSVVSIKFNDGLTDWPATIAGDGLSYTITGFADNAAGVVTSTAAAGFSIAPETGYAGLTVTTSLQNLNFTGTAITYSITGNTGVAGANLDFTGGTPVTADEAGAYNITVPYNWSGTVTPTMAGYAFIPASQEFTNTQTNLTLDFAPALVTHTITGNTGVAGANIDFTGGAPVVTDANGAYSITVPFDWTGAIIPSLAGYVFTPAKQDFANVQADQAYDFSAAVATYTITGNTGVASANIDFTGGSPTVSDSMGAYSISVPYNWTGTVIPSLTGYIFNPASQDFGNVAENKAQDFAPTTLTFTISGNTGMASASIAFTGGTPVITDGTGAYAINVPYNWSGTVTPSLAGYAFTPASQNFANVLENRAQNFSAAALTYTISGNAGVASANIDFSGGTFVTADGTGAYTITVPFNWSGTVTPSLAGFTFTPAGQTFANVTANATQDFKVVDTTLIGPTSKTSSTTALGLEVLNPLAAATAAPALVSASVGSGTYDDTSGSVVYSGRSTLIRTRGPYNRTYHTTNTTAASASLSFTGTRVDYIYQTGYTRGSVRIAIDGIPVTDLNLYAYRTSWQRKWSSPELPSGNHSISITRLDGYANLDAFVVTNNATTPPTPTSIQPTVSAPTQTALPNNTPTKTATKVITQTPVPSFTPTKTAIKTLTQTPVPSRTPTATKTVAATSIPPTGSNTIFKADFESGDFSYFSGAYGEIFGKGTFYQETISHSPAIGSSSAALTIGTGPGTAAYLFTYKVPTTPLAIYSADYYIPGNVAPGDWWNVWQWKSVDETYSKPIVNINILGSSTALQAYVFYTPGGNPANATQMISQTNPVVFPKDRWVHIDGYYMAKSDNTGYVQIYQDGVKIFDIKGIMTKPGNKNVLWSINSYADVVSPNPTTIYIDNMTITESS